MLGTKKQYNLVQLVISSLLVTNFSFGQYIDTLHVTDTLYEYSVNFNHDRQNLVSIHAYYNSNWSNPLRSNVMFKEYDSNYNVILQSDYVDPDFSLYTSRGGMTFDGTAYYYCGYKKDFPNPDTSFAYLLKFDTLGNLIWNKMYDTQAQDAQLLFTRYQNDSLYMVFGKNAAVTGDIETYVASADTAGNIGWTQYFLGDGQVANGFWGTTDGGFLLSTTRQLGINDITSIYKLDPYGNTEWETQLGFAQNYHGLVAYEMPSGNILCYGISEDPMLWTNLRSWMVELTTTGNVVRDTVLDYSNGTDGFGVYNKPLFYAEGFQLIGIIYDDNLADTAKMYVARYDYNFNEIWKRSYYRRENVDAFFFQHDLGNGFTEFAGHCEPDATGLTHDEWFMVLDSVGCNYGNCNLGLETLNNENGLIAHPNPTNDNVWISGLNLSDGPFQFVLHDMQGKVVIDKAVIDTKFLVELPYSGMFVLKVLNNDGIVDVVKVVRRY